MMKSVQYSSLITTEHDDDDFNDEPDSTLPNKQHQALEIDCYNESNDDNDDDYYSNDDEESPTPAQIIRVSPPSNYICPLTLRLINEPVSDECGHTFEKDAICNWLEIHHNHTGSNGDDGFCPISRKPLRKEELYPNIGLKNRIQQWKTMHSHSHSQDHSSSSGGTENTNTTTTTTSTDYKDGVDDDDELFLGIENGYNNNNYGTPTKVKLLLLPQERHVLQMIHNRSIDLRRIRRKKVCLISVAVSVFCLSLIAGLLVLKVWRDGIIF